MIVCRKRWDNKLLPFISSPHFRGNLIPLLLRHIWNTSQYRLKPLQLIIVSLCWVCSSSSRLSTLNTFLQPTVKLLFDINTPALALAGFPTADDHRQLLVKSIHQNEICIFEHLWSNLIQPNSFLQVYWGCFYWSQSWKCYPPSGQGDCVKSLLSKAERRLVHSHEWQCLWF